MIKLFIGYDSKLPAIYNVFAHSVQVRATQAVSTAPLMLSQLGAIFNRPHNPLQSTEFSFSRFLVPYLCKFEGWAIFADNDILCRADIAELWKLRDENYSVMVVKHEQPEKTKTKFLGMPQTAYQKKNWSAVMMFNNAKCKALSPEYVNTASGLELHQFKWLADDSMIGALPKEWNHLVDYDDPNPDAKFVHYTGGGPYFNEYAGCEYSDEWFAEREHMLQVAQSTDIQK